MFSTAGRLVTKARTSLSDDRIDQLMFLHHNSWLKAPLSEARQQPFVELFQKTKSASVSEVSRSTEFVKSMDALNEELRALLDESELNPEIDLTELQDAAGLELGQEDSLEPVVLA